MLQPLSPYQNVSSSITGAGGYVYTAQGLGGSNGNITTASWAAPDTAVTMKPSGVVQLTGDKADVVINGVSLSATLQLIQDRLNMLQPNLAIEQEWDQLRELGEQYRKLEKQLIEKQQAWDILKK